MISNDKKAYNRSDYDILINFVMSSKNSKGKGITAIKALTLKEIASDTKLSEVKVRKTIFNFLEDGFVKEGIKKVRAKTYYISTEGVKELKKLEKSEI